MTAPKVSTIERHCDSHLAIKILHDRGIVTDLEAEAMHARARRETDKRYARIYDTSMANLCVDVLEEIDAPEHVIRAAFMAARGEAELAELDLEWKQAFSALRAAGLEHDADHPIAARYRDASDAVNHARRKVGR